jgi:hypothetical protein
VPTASNEEKIEEILLDQPKNTNPNSENVPQLSQPSLESAAKNSESRPLQKPQTRHETVIRFAAVELEGVFAKN